MSVNQSLVDRALGLARIDWMASRRWLFPRLALLISLALFAPDIWLLIRGEPFEAVGVLMLMHVAVALITYHAAVRLAPPAAHPPGGG